MCLMRSSAFRNTPILLVALSLIAGCGGGVNGSTNVQGAEHQGSVGIGTYSFQGNPKPLVTVSTGAVTSASLAGASFSNIAVHPNASLSNTDLIWSMTVGGSEEVFKFNYPDGPIQAVTNTVPGYRYPTQSKYGQVFCTSIANQSLNQVLIDGTHLKTISTGTSQVFDPSVNPAGSLLAFGDLSLYTCPVAGGTSTAIQANVSNYGISWSPTGASIAYVAYATSSNHIWTTPSTGGTPTDITPAALTGDNFYYPNWSPNGVDVAAETFLSGGSSNQSIVVFPANASGYYQVTTPSGDNDILPAFSPDGSKMAFYRYSTGGANPGIYVQDATGINQQLLFALPANAGAPDNLVWSPSPSAVTYVPNSSFSTSSVSGFILTQNGALFGSLLAFVAKTPSAATITGSPAQSGQPLVFTLSADAITNIVYTNGYFTYATIVTPPASTPSAMVSVDATTGAIDTVATAAKPRTKFTPSTRSIGQNLIYDGPFTAVYGPKGNRLDTNGANQVVIDGKTGKLISFS